MELLAENLNPRGHPLPGPMLPSCPLEAMNDLAVIHDRHRLKA